MYLRTDSPDKGKIYYTQPFLEDNEGGDQTENTGTRYSADCRPGLKLVFFLVIRGAGKFRHFRPFSCKHHLFLAKIGNAKLGYSKKGSSHHHHLTQGISASTNCFPADD
jgi:hypothetical protein